MIENKENNIVREVRKKLGVTQKELAVILEVSEKTIQNWEYGRTIPPIKHQKLRSLLIAPNQCAGDDEQVNRSNRGNPNGWNVSSLTAANETASNVGTPANREDALRNDIEYLKKLLDEERKRSAQYWEMIQKLMTKWNLGI